MDEEIAKRRLLLYTGVRMSGVALCLIGVAIAYGNVLRAGGWPQVGAAIEVRGDDADRRTQVADLVRDRAREQAVVV